MLLVVFSRIGATHFLLASIPIPEDKEAQVELQYLTIIGAHLDMWLVYTLFRPIAMPPSEE